MKLNESISDKVFYYTDLSSGSSILRSGEVKLTPVERNEAEGKIPSNKSYFMSLTRSRYGEYHINNFSGILFELDGRKLSYNYHGEPVDYWGGSNKYEAEDRLYTNEPKIEILQYIKNASILINENMLSDRNKLDVLDTLLVLKKNDIPFYVYDNEKNWLAGKEKGSLEFSKIREMIKVDDSFKVRKDVRKMANYGNKRENSIDAFIELYHKDNKEDLSKNARDILSTILRYNIKDSGIEQDIHNSSGLVGKGHKDNLAKLLKLKQKSGHKKLEDFLKSIKDKWLDKENEEMKKNFLKSQKKNIEYLNKVLSGKEDYDHKNIHKNEEYAAFNLVSLLTRLRSLKLGHVVEEHFPEINHESDSMANMYIEMLVNKLTGIDV